MTAGKKILVLDVGKGVWGAQSYLLRLAQPLAERGYDLVLAAPRELELAAAWRARGLPYVDVDLPLVRSVRVGGDDDARVSVRAATTEAAVLLRNVRTIGRVARETGAVAIHANGHGIHLDAALGGRLAGVPVVLHLHEEMEPLFGRTLRAAAVATAPMSIAVSRAVAAGVPRALAKRVDVVANGVDVQHFTPGAGDPALRASLGAGVDDVLLVATTRLDPDKRIEDLIDALSPLRDEPGWHLTVIGSTSSYPEYASEVRRLASDRLGDRVTFTGRREDVDQVLRSADVLVHAGVVEGMPLGIIEAQAAGLPVVAYRIAGIPEAVVEGSTALLADPRNVPELRGHIGRLIGDAGLRRRMGQAARAAAVERHGLDLQADRQAALLDELTGGAPARAPGAAAGRPRVLLANHWHDDNRGDSAITQGILTLLRSVAPDAEVTMTTLTERGALWDGSTRHIERFWPGLRALPSPIPTELRGRRRERSKPLVAVDVARWWVRLARHLPGFLEWTDCSPWRRHVRAADLVVLVGGSNLFDDPGVPAVISVPRLAEVLSPAQAGLRSGTPVLVLGHTLGPFTRGPARRLARRVLGSVSELVIRESRSQATATDLGIGATVEAPDMAFAILPEQSATVDRMLRSLPSRPERTLVLSARQHPILGTADNDRLVQVFADTARSLIEAGLIDGVAVVPHTIGPTPVEDDRPISEQLVAALSGVPVTLVDDDVSPAELSAFYGAVAAVVAVRLHASILAVNAGTPSYAVAYLTAKSHGVMTQVGLPDAVGDYESVTAGEIVAEVTRQLTEPGLREELLARATARRRSLFDAAAGWFAAVRPAADDDEAAA